MQKLQWEAIAYVLLYGYQWANYFLVNLLHLFVALYLYGDEVITSETLI